MSATPFLSLESKPGFYLLEMCKSLWTKFKGVKQIIVAIDGPWGQCDPSLEDHEVLLWRVRWELIIHNKIRYFDVPLAFKFTIIIEILTFAQFYEARYWD